MLDFPLPVEPINAVVSPGLAVKLILWSTSSSPPGYLKETLLNSINPVHFFSLDAISLFLIDETA